MKHITKDWRIRWLELRLWWVQFTITLAETRRAHIEASLRELDDEAFALKHELQTLKGYYS